MKKTFKIILLLLTVLISLIIGFICYVLIVTSSVNLDKNKLVDFGKITTFYDSDDNIISKESSNIALTNIDDIPSHVLNAFIAIEDKRFYNHDGVDYHGLTRALFNNIKTLSFKEGASTISQQLIKNTHLSSEKTLNRKFIEIKLAKQLEKEYSKNEILEKYLNTIYFGDNCYGITLASNHYFNKSPEELSLNESATLAGIIKAPSNYSPLINFDKCNKRKNIVLSEMYNQGYISLDEYNKNVADNIEIKENCERGKFDYTYLVKKELDDILTNKRINDKKIKVYTYCDTDLQSSIEQNLTDNLEYTCDKSSVMIDKNYHYVAYKSSCGDINRQMGSTIKPLAVYAPAIENNVINSCSPVLDEKINFNGYEPSNYNDKYYGYVSAKQSLSKSLNVPAVKILNSLGVEKSIKYLKKLEIPLDETDNTLVLALGATKNGISLTQICSTYTIFSHEGFYKKPTCIKKITDENDNILYQNNNKSEKIFESDTVFIINDMLRHAVTDGTAKKLSFNDYKIHAKTGTVGYEKGNTDAYTISYTNDYVLGVWCGIKDNSLMSNSITGGTLPASISANIWKETYKDKQQSNFKACDNVIECNIDKISYDENHIVEMASKYTPDRFIQKEIFKKNNIPKTISARFSEPTIKNGKISVNNNGILIELCVTEYYEFKIFKECNGKKNQIFNSLNDGRITEYEDNNLSYGKVYTYSIIPYIIHDNKEILGKEYILPKIKTPTKNVGDNWWYDDF